MQVDEALLHRGLLHMKLCTCMHSENREVFLLCSCSASLSPAQVRISCSSVVIARLYSVLLGKCSWWRLVTFPLLQLRVLLLPNWRL